MQVEEIKFNYDLGVFGDTLKRIVLKEYPHRLTDFIDSFSNNQVTCKKWLVLELLKILKNKPDFITKKITILGSWYGNVLVPLLVDNIKGLENINLIDMDEDALDIGRKFLGRKYNGVTINYLKEDINFTDFSTKYTNICINTSCEHMLPMDSISFQNDDNVLYVLQSNDMKNIREHVNCVNSNEEFIKQASLSRTYYHGKKRLEAQNKKKYWRFMIIGRRDD